MGSESYYVEGLKKIMPSSKKDKKNHHEYLIRYIYRAEKAIEIVRSLGFSSGMVDYNKRNKKYQEVLLPIPAKYELQKPIIRRFLRAVWIYGKNETGLLAPINPVELVPCAEKEKPDVWVIYWKKWYCYKLPKGMVFVDHK